MVDPDPKPLHQYRLWEFQALRDALVIAALVGLIWLGNVLSLITVPLLIGFGLAYLIEPVVRRIAGWRFMNRARAVLLIIATAILLIGGLLAFTVPPLVRQAISLADNADSYAARAHGWLHHPDRPAWLRQRAEVLDAALAKAGWHPGGGPAQPVPAAAPEAGAPAAGPPDEARIRQMIHEELAKAQSSPADPATTERILGLLKALGSGAASLAGGLFTAVLTIGIAAVAMVSFSLAWPKVLDTAHDLIPAAHRGRVLELVGRMDRTVSAFVRGRITVAAIVGCLYAIGWTVVGVPYGLVLGLVVGLLSLVPYLAAVGLPAAWVLLALHLITEPDPGSWYLAAGSAGATSIIWWKVLVLPLVVNFIVQQTEDYVLNPLIQGKATELHPAVIMVAVIAGGTLAGLYGMLLAVPVAACGKILLTAELLPRFKRWAGRPEDAGRPPA